MKKKEKIGLVLGGGGGKGAYQIGILKAMEEYKLHKYISCISGTSIGALNAAMYLSEGVDKAVSIWSKMNSDVVLARKSIKDIIVDKCLFSRDGIVELATKEIDIKKIQSSPIELYVLATPMGRKNMNAQNTFKMNELSDDKILKVLLASSAIPYAFEPVTINGVKYKDGYAIDNVPVKTLKDLGCTTIFVVPLREYSPAEKYADQNTKIIDFMSVYNDYGLFDGTLDFDSQRSKMRMEHGYNVAKQLIEKLIKEGVIAVKWRHKITKKWKNRKSKKKEEPSYYHVLSKEEILFPPTNLPEARVNPELTKLYNLLKKERKRAVKDNIYE